PKPGETLLGGEFVQVAGGKGANQAVAAARLGAEVSFVARVGQDALGHQAIENFKADGIITDFIGQDSERPSGVALIMVDNAGENMIAVASGANAELSPLQVDGARGAFQEAAVLLLQLETPLVTVSHAARLARQAGMKVILNPAPACELDDALLQNVSIITPNETETEILTGILPENEAAAKAAGKALRKRGVETAVITMGEKGAYISSPKVEGMVAALSVTAVDTTAAGDAFNGALACAMASGYQLEEAVKFSNRVAAFSVTRLGAQPSLPTRQDLDHG
ncbi:MAG: ribokinase, partial [Acidobacteriota bacterium]